MLNKKVSLFIIAANVLLLGAVVFFIGNTFVQADTAAQTTPHVISYQGVLADDSGNPINGNRNLNIAVYAAQTGGTSLWQETHANVRFAAGAFNIMLGSVTAMPNDLFDTPDRWLEMTVNGITLSPRQQFSSVPYALNADKVDGLDAADLGGIPSGAVIWFEDGTTPTGFTQLNEPGIDIGITEILPPAPNDSCSSQVKVWTGNEVLCWASDYGGRYHVVNSSWVTMSITSAPLLRYKSSFTWTGNEMIIWGGKSNSYPAILYNTGSKYDPNTDSWSAMTTVDAPSPRYMNIMNHTPATWIGSKMFIWGGYVESDVVTDTGGLYDSIADLWSPITMIDAPTARANHLAVWTGNKVIVWGGTDGANTLKDGGIYDPAADSWTPIANNEDGPSNTGYGYGYWTGTEMIVLSSSTPYRLYFYNPVTDQWRQSNATVMGSDTFINTGMLLVDNNLLVFPKAVYDISLDKVIAIRQSNYSSGIWTGETLLNRDINMGSKLRIVSPYAKD